MSFADEKACVLSKVVAVGCEQKAQLSADLVDYDSILPLIFSNSNLFCCSPDYMVSLLDCFDNAELLSRGIHYNQSGGSASNPRAIINSQYNEVIFDEGPLDETGLILVPTLDPDTGEVIEPDAEPYTIPEVVFLGKLTTVDKISVIGGTTVGLMTIGGGAVAGTLDAQKEEPVGGTEDILNNQVNYLRLVNCRGNNSVLGVILDGSDVPNIRRDEGSVFGGYGCTEISTTLCTNPVTDYDVRNEGPNSVSVTWIAPANSLYVKLGYRAVGEKDYKDIDMGSWDDNFTVVKEDTDPNPRYSYTFNNLNENTWYEFQLVNFCADGQPSYPGYVKAITKVRQPTPEQ